MLHRYAAMALKTTKMTWLDALKEAAGDVSRAG